MSDYCILYTTFPTPEDAEQTAEDLVHRKLAACVNLFLGMVSIYEWKGEFNHTPEVAAFIKTKRANVEKIMDHIRETHPYETPALLVLPVEAGHPAYLSWMKSQMA
jgi:periplasmic divalent cation tolerance protein